MNDPNEATKTPIPDDTRFKRPDAEQERAPADLVGTKLGRFQIESVIGRGGMGQVYRAQDSVLKRVVAIKRMAPQLVLTELGRERFLREAQRASALNHPNIAAIYDVIDQDGEVFLVMEYIEGTSLRSYLDSHKLTIPEFLTLTIQIAEALGAAHQQQILHGDIKPENIMLTPSHRVKILDFGVARRIAVADAMEATQSMTVTSSLAGTPAYMAPEVLQQKSYDGRADLFSLGLVCYEMLGGPHPFQTDSFAGTLGRVLHTDPAPIREINRSVPGEIEAVLNRLLAKDPADRYPSANLLVADLQIVQQGGKPKTIAIGQAKTEIRRKGAPVLFILLAAAVLAGLGLVGLKAYLTGKSNQTPAPTAASIPQERILAILPYDATNTDPSLASLGQGVLSAVASRLGGLSEEHALQIIPARNLQERGITTLADARKQFGATIGLNVSLRQENELLRLTYSLVDAQSGRMLGGDTITVPSSDAFTIEDDVLDGTLRVLKLKLRPEESAALQVHGTSQPAAYNYYLRARGYLLNFTSAESLENAITMIREALKVDPNFGMAKAALGEAYWRKYWHTKQANWTKLARQECDAAVKLGNSGAAGHACLGLVLDGTGNYKDAATEYQRAVDLDPRSEDYAIGLALAFEHQGENTKAEQTYQQTVESHPQSWVAANSLGNFYFRRNELDNAAKYFKRVTELAPEGYAGYVNLGAVYNRQYKFPEAIEALKKSLILRPSNAAYINIGTAYMRMHQYAQAASAYEQSLKLESKQYVTWGNLGEAHYYGGNKPAAMQAYAKAAELAVEDLKVNPRDSGVLADLANYHAMMGHAKEAHSYMEQALRYGRSDNQILAVAAFVYNQLGETSLALEWLSRAVLAGFPAKDLENEPGLKNLSDNPQFKELIARSASK